MADDGAASSQESLDEVDECLLSAKIDVQRDADGAADVDMLSSSGRGAAERGRGADSVAESEERLRRRERLGGAQSEPIDVELIDLSAVLSSAGQAGSSGHRSIIVLESDDPEMDEAATDEAAADGGQPGGGGDRR